MKRSILFTLLAAFVLASCSKVPITGRKQLNLLPASQMMEMSATAYGEFLTEHPPLPQSNADAQKVERVGVKISKAVETYLNNNGYKKMAKEFKWEFHTVQDPTVNAWCMPGGRVVFFTGILPICQDEAGIAVVMGHEVAHAVARHGNERMSQQIGIQAAGMTLDVLLSQKPDLTRNLLLQSFGIGSELGSLAFSRSHESEADKLGLIFMAMAGYNPQEAPKFWTRMSQQSDGGAPPEILSTHPADETRINDLNDYMPKAMEYYKP